MSAVDKESRFFVRTWILFDDPASECLQPFTWVRPASELRIGMETLLERWNRLVHPDPLHVLTSDSFQPLDPERITCEEIDLSDGDVIWVSDLIVPNESLVARLRELPAGGGASFADSAFGDGHASVGGASGGGRDSASTSTSSTRMARRGAPPARLTSLAQVREWIGAASDSIELDATEVIRGLADLLRFHESLLPRDLERWVRDNEPTQGIGDGAAYNRSDIWVGQGCRIDHGAVLDAREGPIVLGPHTQVFPHTWIRGPFHAVGDSHLLGGRIGGGTALGRQCRVRGEVEASVFLGYDNKAHDGFVGHSYLGEWVNLGALTTTSDLKNNYGTVHLEIRGRKIDTGSRKVGSFLGDHVKTRIGTMLNTGAVVGLGANLFSGDAVFPKWVPDFSWGGSAQSESYALERFLATTRIVMGRRQVELTPAIEAMLRAAYHASMGGPIA